MDDDGLRRIMCEACLRWRAQSHFPSKVVASVEWHEAHPDMPRGRTIHSCKECRAQQVNDRERIEAFLNFRLPDSSSEE